MNSRTLLMSLLAASTLPPSIVTADPVTNVSPVPAAADSVLLPESRRRRVNAARNSQLYVKEILPPVRRR